MKVSRHVLYFVRHGANENHALLRLAIERQLAEIFPDTQVVTTEKRMGRDVFFTVVAGDGVIVMDGETNDPIIFKDDDGGTCVVAEVYLRNRFDRSGAGLRLDLGPSLDHGEFFAAVGQQMRDILVEADRTSTDEFDPRDLRIEFEEIPKGTPPPVPRASLWI